MFCTLPNWMGLLLAAALVAMVLAIVTFPDQVAACDRTMFCESGYS